MVAIKEIPPRINREEIARGIINLAQRSRLAKDPLTILTLEEQYKIERDNFLDSPFKPPVPEGFTIIDFSAPRSQSLASQPADPEPASLQTSIPLKEVQASAAQLYSEPLSELEKNIITMVALGNTLEEIGITLDRSGHAIGVHIAPRIYAKLGAQDSIGAVLAAVEQGILIPYELMKDYDPMLIEGLGERERAFVEGMANRVPDEEIAAKFRLTRRSLQTHNLEPIFDSLGVKNRMQAIMLFLAYQRVKAADAAPTVSVVEDKRVEGKTKQPLTNASVFIAPPIKPPQARPRPVVRPGASEKYLQAIAKEQEKGVKRREVVSGAIDLGIFGTIHPGREYEITFYCQTHARHDSAFVDLPRDTTKDSWYHNFNQSKNAHGCGPACQRQITGVEPVYDDTDIKSAMYTPHPVRIEDRQL